MKQIGNCPFYKTAKNKESFQVVCTPAFLVDLYALMWFQTHTEHVHSSLQQKWSHSAVQHTSLVFCCQQYLLTKTLENKYKSRGLFLIISFWTTFFPLLYRCRLCLNNWISSAAQSQSASNLRQEPSLNVSTAGSVLTLVHWSAAQTHSTTHILRKPKSYLWFILSNMHDIK